MNKSLLWSKEEIEYIKKNYTFENKEVLLSVLTNRTWDSIQVKAKSIGLSRTKWSNDEIKYLIKNFPTVEKNIIINNLHNKTWKTIERKAQYLGLKRKWRTELGKNLIKLLNDDPITLYWIGFLLADGHFSKKGELSCSLSIIDKEHLIKLSNYLELTNNITYLKSRKNKLNTKIINSGEQILFKVGNYFYVNKIKEKFNITNTKTYDPPELKFLNSTQLLSLFIGFIDGDGYINNRPGIKISLHKNWVNILLLFHNALEQKLQKNIALPFVKGNTTIWNLGNFSTIKFLKIFALCNQLPLLERKWGKINLNQIKRNKKFNFLMQKK